MNGGKEVHFVRFIIFSLYGYIGPALVPEPLSHGSRNSQFRFRRHDHHNLAFRFSLKYTGVEKKSFKYFINLHRIAISQYW